MTNQSTVSNVVFRNKNFMLYSIMHAILSIAVTFQFIAVTSLLVRTTGSGLSAGFGVACTPIISIFLSPIAGIIGDRFYEKNILFILNCLRGFAAILFIKSDSLVEIYAIMIIFSAVEIFYHPSYKKMMSNILTHKEIINGNSIITGISGFISISGTMLAGVIISIYGMRIIFIIISISFFISALILLNIKTNTYKNKKVFLDKKHKLMPLRLGKRHNQYYIIKEMIITGTVISLGMASMNITFYPFAFDVLKVTDKTWGKMMSIFYGANFIAMFIAIWLNSRNKSGVIFIYLSAWVVSIIWFCYGFSYDLTAIYMLQLIEGIALSLSAILLNTQLQIAAERDAIARVMAINDTFNNIGKIIGIGFTYIILKIFHVKLSFLIYACILFVFILFRLPMVLYNMKFKQGEPIA